MVAQPNFSPAVAPWTDFGCPREFPRGPRTIQAALAAQPASLPLMSWGETTWTVGHFDQASLDLARRLVSDGVQVGQPLAWSLSSPHDLLVAFLATVRAGAVWLAIDQRATAHEEQHIVESIGCGLPRRELSTWDPTLGPVELPAPDPWRPAAIGHTSGTTGQSKGAVHLHQQLLYPGAASLEQRPPNGPERIATPLSLATFNIMLLVPLVALVRGACAVIVEPQKGLAEQLVRYAATEAVIVPAQLRDLAVDDALANVSTLHSVIVGGARLDQEAADRVATRGITVISSYGMTETPTGVARRTSGETGATLLPGIRATVSNDGEILLAPTQSGPWAGCWSPTLGYWNRPEASSDLYRDGWLHTGDRGSVDKDGRLSVLERIASMINRGGATIAPQEVEDAIHACPGVDDVVVFGADDQRLGQRIVAAVVGQGLDAATLRNCARQRLSGHKVPDDWLFVDAFPRTTSGKVDRNALRELAASPE